MPVAVVINGELFAVHSDHLNTPRRLTNSQGQPVWQWAYSAFGDEKPTIAKYRFANLDINPNPGMAGIAETVFNLRKPGQYDDAESGLAYNGARSYCPVCGRFTQPDPAGLDGGWSPYEYVLNDPLSMIDDDGFAPKKLTPAQPLAPINPVAGSGGGRLFDSGRITPIPVGVPGRSLSGEPGTGAGRGNINPPCLPALPVPRLADHHLLPRQFKEFFAARGISIDDHTVTLGETSHLKGVHGSGLGSMPGRWNQAWSQWINENPNAGPGDDIDSSGA